ASAAGAGWSTSAGTSRILQPPLRTGVSSLLPRSLGFPGTRMTRCVAVFYPVVEMIVGSGAERQVIQAGQTKPFAQVFVEGVQFLELIGLRRNLFSRGSPQ